MAVTIKRQEPVTAPPPQEVVVHGNASGRGVTFTRSHSGLKAQGTHGRGASVTRDPNGFTTTMTKQDALDFIEALQQLLGVK